MSKTTDFAELTACWSERSIASGNTLRLTLLLPVAKPPCEAHAFAAAGVARNFTNASIAGVSRKVTKRSPLISTAVESGPGVIDGKGATLKPVPAFAFVDERITPETKSASKTIAAFGGVPNAFVTESLNPYWSAPLVPPAIFDVSPTIFAIVVRAVFTEGSVHLILWAESASYFAAPNVRR